MNVLEKILEEIQGKMILVATSKEHYNQPQNGKYVEEVITIKDAENIVHSHIDGIPNCEGCSRRKWYQKGFEDGKKDNDWIPVEEKLPEEDERYKGRKVIDVLVTTAKGKVTKVQRQSHNGYWWWGRIYGEPTAWQPLPEPYIKNLK